MAIALIVSQIVVALISSPLGRVAQSRGRRLVLLFGFAAMMLRCLLLSIDRHRYAIVAFQVLDGFSGAAIGVMVPLSSRTSPAARGGSISRWGRSGLR